MNMRIDEAGSHDQVAHVQDACLRRGAAGGAALEHGLDAAIAVEQHLGRRHPPVWQHDARAPQAARFDHQNSTSANRRKLSRWASRSSTNSEPVIPATSRCTEYFIPEMLAPPNPRLNSPPNV